jgi:hypothetical protein
MSWSTCRAALPHTRASRSTHSFACACVSHAMSAGHPRARGHCLWMSAATCCWRHASCLMPHTTSAGWAVPSHYKTTPHATRHRQPLNHKLERPTKKTLGPPAASFSLLVTRHRWWLVGHHHHHRHIGTRHDHDHDHDGRRAAGGGRGRVSCQLLASYNTIQLCLTHGIMASGTSMQCNILHRGHGPQGRCECERSELRAAKPKPHAARRNHLQLSALALGCIQVQRTNPRTPHPKRRSMSERRALPKPPKCCFSRAGSFPHQATL